MHKEKHKKYKLIIVLYNYNYYMYDEENVLKKKTIKYDNQKY